MSVTLQDVLDRIPGREDLRRILERNSLRRDERPWAEPLAIVGAGPVFGTAVALLTASSSGRERRADLHDGAVGLGQEP